MCKCVCVRVHAYVPALAWPVGGGVDEVGSQRTRPVHLLPPVASSARPSMVAGGVRGVRGTAGRGAALLLCLSCACPSPSPVQLLLLPSPPVGLSSSLHRPCTFLPLAGISPCSPCPARLRGHLCRTLSPVLLHPGSLWPLLLRVPAELPAGRSGDGAGRHLPSSGCAR